MGDPQLLDNEGVTAVWVYLLAIVLVPVALAVVSFVLDSYRFGEMLQEFDCDGDTGEVQEREQAA